MSKDFEYDVFLSYSFEDKDIVHSLAVRLKNDGLNVWMDTWEIKAGDQISIKIQEGLEKSRTLLMCMSPAYFESEWTRLEHHSLLFRDPTNEQRRFIPLLIKDCKIPDVISQFAHSNWQNITDDAYNKLIIACKRKVIDTIETTNIESGTIRKSKVLKGHMKIVWSVAITPDGKRAVSGSADYTLKIWDIKSGKCQATLRGYWAEVITVAISPDNKYIVSSSKNNTIIIRDIKTGQCRATLEGHINSVVGLAISPDGHTIVSSSLDNTIKAWDLETGKCYATFEGYSQGVTYIAISPDGKTVISGSLDKTIKIWDIKSGHCQATFEGHSDAVYCVAISPEGKIAASGSWDKTIKIWDIDTGHCQATFEGHSDMVLSLAISPDGKSVVSGSYDNTLKIWDIQTGHCQATYEGHSDAVHCVVFSPDNKTVVSCSYDSTIRIWDIPKQEIITKSIDYKQYTNAKVVLVGESGVGKTGLALRLAENRWQETGSTHGMKIWPLDLPKYPLTESQPEGSGPNMEHEVWLWDFAGQPDYRLIHQLFMDETALALMVIDPQRDNPFEPLGHWENAIKNAVKHDPDKLLIAGRCNRGSLTISRKKVEQYLQEHGYKAFLSTSAQTGEGCEELKALIARNIPWERLPWTATTRLFKTLKDAIIRTKEKDIILIRISELHQRLKMELEDRSIKEDDLRTVVGLLAGQGLIQKLDFGDFVLLQPEQINNYASVVVRSARENTDEIGCVPEQDILEAGIDFKDMKRLKEADEKILLRAMLQTFLDRSLCARVETNDGTQLVFPSYFKLDRPEFPEQPNIVVTYGFSGTLDEIYTTLVVRLHYTNEFDMDKLWKYAADFKTFTNKHIGLLMTKQKDDFAEIQVYFEADIQDDTKVSFIKYIHEHLKRHAHDVTRVRSYVCPHCDTPLENRKAIKKRLEMNKTDIICGVCEERVLLIDIIEDKFASNEFQRRVQEMDEQARINLDSESLSLILEGQAKATVGEAGHIYRDISQHDWGIDGEIEFKNDEGKACGKRVYLQLKSGVSHLRYRQRDDSDIFDIDNPRWAEYWQTHEYPVMLVIRTSDKRIQWMNVTDYLKKHGANIKQIVFEGEPFTAPNVAKLGKEMLKSK